EDETPATLSLAHPRPAPAGDRIVRGGDEERQTDRGGRPGCPGCAAWVAFPGGVTGAFGSRFEAIRELGPAGWPLPEMRGILKWHTPGVSAECAAGFWLRARQRTGRSFPIIPLAIGP